MTYTIQSQHTVLVANGQSSNSLPFPDAAPQNHFGMPLAPQTSLLSGFYLGRGILGGRGKCALDRGLGPSPQGNVNVPLSKHINPSVFTDRQELSQCHYLNCN